MDIYAYPIISPMCIRGTQATANASEGILLLAGAVASHSMEGLDDADDQESAST